MNSFMDQMKKVGKGMVEGSKKTMLKTDIMFLEREIKARKQKFGVEVFDLMESLENITVNDESELAEKEQNIRQAFDNARRDVIIAREKIEVKRQELSMHGSSASAGGGIYTGEYGDGMNGNLGSSREDSFGMDSPPRR